MTDQEVRLQIVLKNGKRLPDHVEDVCRRVERLGMEVTGRGAATVSARADSRTFERLFGHPPPPAAAPQPEDGNFGFEESETLSIPTELSEMVDNVSIAPVHRHF